MIFVSVIPAQAGIQGKGECGFPLARGQIWIPVFTGMTTNA